MERSEVIVPPVLYLPVYTPRGRDDRVAVVATLTDGRTGLLAYTALDRLVAGCGDRQPWIAVALGSLADIKRAQPFDVIAFDVDAPAVLHRIEAEP